MIYLEMCEHILVDPILQLSAKRKKFFLARIKNGKELSAEILHEQHQK